MFFLKLSASGCHYDINILSRLDLRGLDLLLGSCGLVRSIGLQAKATYGIPNLWLNLFIVGALAFRVQRAYRLHGKKQRRVCRYWNFAVQLQ